METVEGGIKLKSIDLPTSLNADYLQEDETFRSLSNPEKFQIIVDLQYAKLKAEGYTPESAINKLSIIGYQGFESFKYDRNGSLSAALRQLAEECES